MTTTNRKLMIRVAALAFFSGSGVWAQNQVLTSQQKEVFLAKAKIVATRSVSKGVTGTSRVTLSDGVTTHDASVQTIDEYKQVFQAAGGKTEINFKDTYRFNIAAWKLAEMIGLGFMVPPSVERGLSGKAGSFTWWVEDVQMDEGERLKQKASAPDQTAWLQEYALLKMFDQLIHNNDRNVGNILIDKNWHIWMIDHSRAFRLNKTLPKIGDLTRIDRGVLARLKTLDEKSLNSQLGKFATKGEIQAVLARRNLIVNAFESKGEAALFDLSAAK